MSYGPHKEGGSATEVQRNDGQACLLMPWDMMFSEQQQEQQRRQRGAEGVGSGRKEEEREKKAMKKSGGHMSPL